MSEVIFLNQAADGTSAHFNHTGGRLAFWVYGTFNAVQVQVEIQSPTGTWVGVSDGIWTAADVKTLEMPPCVYRMKLSGTDGANPPDISAESSGL